MLALGAADAVAVARAGGVLVNCSVADAVALAVDVGVTVIVAVRLGLLVGVAGQPCSADPTAAMISLMVTTPSPFESPAGHWPVPESVRAMPTSVMISAMVTVPFPSQSPAQEASAL